MPCATTPKPPKPRLRTSARKSASRITERASPLLGQVADASERDALEITIETLHGLAATRVLGAGDEAKSAFQRAYSLLGEAPQHPMLGRLLHGFGWMLCLRAEYAEALAVADRAEALGSATNDPVLLSTACTVHGEVDQLQGRSRAARTWLERGLALAERLDVGPGEFLVDPQVALLGLLANPLAPSRFGTAGARVRAARTCARSRSGMAHGAACRNLARRDARGAARQTPSEWPLLPMKCRRSLTNSRSLTVELLAGGFAAGRTPEWGNRATVIAAFERRTKTIRGLGCWREEARSLGYAAEALVLAGDWDGAQRELEDALRVADTLGERVYLPQLFVMQAAIARARGDRAAADAAIRRAIAEARAQEAPWLELMALDRTVRPPQRNGRRPTRACRAHRPASRSARHSHRREGASTARQD